jgi:hypothetical protein
MPTDRPAGASGAREVTRPRSRTRTFRFSPGYLESVILRVWTKPSRSSMDHAKLYAARIEGTLDLCDGDGYLERVTVNAEDCAWSSDPGDRQEMIATVRQTGDLQAAEALAHQLSEYAIEEAGR